MSFNLSPLEKVPKWAAREIEGKGGPCDCWWWTSLQHGSQCKVLCIHSILLYHALYNSFCICTGIFIKYIISSFMMVVVMLAIIFLDCQMIYIACLVQLTSETKLVTVQLWTILVFVEAVITYWMWVYCSRYLSRTDTLLLPSTWKKSYQQLLITSTFGILRKVSFVIGNRRTVW